MKNRFRLKQGEKSRGVLKGMAITVGGGVALSLIFWLLLAAVYSLPSSALSQNLHESADILASEGLYPSAYVSSDSFDNFTVALMLNEASQTEMGNPFSASLGSWYCSGKNQIEGLQNAVDGETGQISYARYWHGYLIYLKPLLIFLNIKQIRILLQSVFIVLLGLAAIVLSRRLRKVGIAAAVALLMSMGILGCMDAVSTLPMFPSFALSIVGVIGASVVSLDKKQSLFLGFALMGALTVYFDFLDNPILTLGLPLAVVLLRCYESNCDLENDRFISLRNFIKDVLILFALACLGWVVGYGYLWILKWVLATLFTDVDVLGSAINAATFRTGVSGSEEYGTSPILALSLNVAAMGWVKYAAIAVLLLSIVGLVIYVLNARRLASSRADERTRVASLTVLIVIFLLAVAVIPYVWYIVLSNHSCIHTFFTFRNQIISLFCIGMVAVVVFSNLVSICNVAKLRRKEMRLSK